MLAAQIIGPVSHGHAAKKHIKGIRLATMRSPRSAGSDDHCLFQLIDVTQVIRKYYRVGIIISDLEIRLLTH